MNKIYFENKIKEVLNKPFKTRFIQKGKYGKPECWLYPVINKKQQKMNSKGNYLIHPDGSPVMESKTGLLITLETLENKEYLLEYLESCF